jgi:C4-dicarboxylate transporter, DctM subunit
VILKGLDNALSRHKSGSPMLMPVGKQTEEIVASAALLLIAILPVIELLLRALCHTGIPGTTGYVQNLTLWVGFIGAMLAARAKQHLTFIPALDFFTEKWRRRAGILSATVSATVAFALALASFQFVGAEFNAPTPIAGWLPAWLFQTILPVSFAVIAIRYILQAGDSKARAIAALSLPALIAIGGALTPYAPKLLVPGCIALAAAGLLGAPIFAILGGVPLLLFFANGVPIASIPVETYRLAASPTIPTLPLFAFTGFILTEAGTSRRLLRLFQALFGWLPGGLPIVVTLLCAFFTTFTGASGVTILALGGLLLPVLRQSGYSERFSVGLLTATGSIGILFPPSLPVILYAVVAHIPIVDLFKAGIVPGTLMVAAVCAFGIWKGTSASVSRRRFDRTEAVRAAI